MESPLRQRRRAETRREIQRAAVELVRTRGLAQVTVDDIAAAAGVSPRTFFNYFPTKREALVSPPPPLPEASLARFVAGGSGDLLVDLRDLLIDQIQQSPRERHEMQQVHRVVTANPELSPLLLERYRTFEAMLTDAVARRLGHTRPAFDASVIAAVAAAVLRAAAANWRDTDTEDTLRDQLHEAFAAVEHHIRQGK